MRNTNYELCILELDNVSVVVDKDENGREAEYSTEADDERSDDANFSSISDETCEDEITKNQNFRRNLKNWALQFNINQSAMKVLIQIINERLDKNVLPQDPRTLMETPQTIETIHVGDGEYWHNGLQFCLQHIFAKISSPIDISLNINMDGLPIFKSSKDEFWPILANIAEFPKQKPMVVGIYCGKSKPTDLNSYLMPFVEELKPILAGGICVNGYKISVKIRCFILDSPARAFIKGKLHSNADCNIMRTYIHILRI